jgi:hypothetical protein
MIVFALIYAALVLIAGVWAAVCWICEPKPTAEELERSLFRASSWRSE